MAEGPKNHYVLLVSGAPASGKTSLALKLAAALDFSLLSKDVIKEALFDTLHGNTGDLEFSRQSGNAAMEILWALAGYCPQVILEANFRPRSEYERGHIAGIRAQKLEIYCRIPAELAAQRFADRAATTEHHPAHAAKIVTRELMAEYDQPIALCPVIEADTTRPVNVAALLKEIHRHWPYLADCRSISRSRAPIQ